MLGNPAVNLLMNQGFHIFPRGFFGKVADVILPAAVDVIYNGLGIGEDQGYGEVVALDGREMPPQQFLPCLKGER